ncbi:MAG: carboxylesterase/lipase family protein [Dehalococcoidales bacterium]|nr:carboxylesterase/lipase family protein [Dehalococcoidales bacterium]
MSPEPVVSTKAGKIEGFGQNSVRIFKGIPFAAAPVGNLRWMPPQPLEPWSGVRLARSYGAISAQNIMGVSGPGVPSFADQPQSEDCLYLNVWTPGLDDARRPVMYWIHGGAFIIGSGSESFLDAGNLARRGEIVLVSINYRLGAAGFMNLKEITGGRIPATGNEGLLDQIAGLEWVRDNIAAFGGDPDNVTVFGFSAGGMSIGNLLAMPAARGTFHKAINRSGAANIAGTLDSAVRITGQYLDIFGLKGKDIDGIRGLTTWQLLDSQEKLSAMLREKEYRATPFQPVVDGSTLPDYPMAAIGNGSAKNIPVMAGNTRDELKTMNAMDPAVRALDEAGVVERLKTMLPAGLVPGLVQAYRDSLTASGAAIAPHEILGSINTDMMFRIPTIRLVEAQRDHGMPAYNYLFAYRSPAMGGALGAMHGLDNPFLFGVLDSEFTGDSPEARELALRIQDSCAAFARTGDPSCPSNGVWPAYGKERMTMIFGAESRVESAPFEAERRAWDSYDMVANTPI